MSASPPGPVQLLCGRGQVLAQSGEQPADLVTGQREELVLMSGSGLGRGQDGQERVGEQGQDGPAVPGSPVADLVLVQGGEPVLSQPPLMPVKNKWSLAFRRIPGRY